MQVLHLIRPRHIGDLVAYEMDLNYCRETITILSGAGLVPHFSVLGQVLNGAGSAVIAALGTNTGNPTFGAITVAAGTEVGEYDLVMEDATHFVVLQPPADGLGGSAGEEIGHGVFGTPFAAGGLGFTGTAGGTPAVAGDSQKITVTDAAGSQKYVPVSATATDGSQTAKAISILDVDATSADQLAPILARGPMIVRAEELIWPTGATTPQIAAWTANLGALSPPILVRASG